MANYSFENQDGTFFNEQGSAPVAVYTPLTGATIALSSGSSMAFLNPAGTIAALTLLMPPNPNQGQTMQLSFKQIVTALTLQDASGVAISGAASAGAVGISTTLKFIGTTWVKWD